MSENIEKSEEDRLVSQKIERKILIQILSISIIAVFLYFINALFVVKLKESAIESIYAGVLYSGLLAWVYFSKKAKYAKEVISVFFLISVVSGFFVLGGFKGTPAFDFLNLFLMCAVIFEGKTRNVYLLILAMIASVLYFVQLFLPNIIENRLANSPDWVMLSEIVLRFFLTFNIGMAFRGAYIREHKKANLLLADVRELNDDINTQNEELKSMHEELLSSNERLEELVKARTKSLEEQNEKLIIYAYMNSHIFRGPVSRIQGLLGLMEIEKEESKKAELYGLLLNEIHNVDRVIKDISIILYEKDGELMEELKMKARKLYGMPEQPY